MKRLFKNWRFWKYFILCFIISLGIGSIDRLFGYKEAASIGIIGGSDGPTAIFLTGSGYLKIFNMMVLICLLILYVPIKKLIKKIK